MNAGKSLRQVCGAGGDTIVTGLATDSRRVAPGDLFLARTGALHDAHEHVPEAVRRGAVAVCSERPVATTVPNVVIPDLQARLGGIAARFFDDPSAELTCIGVTGTNGKTSIAWLCAALLDDTACMGTLGWGLPPHLCPTALTTEDPVAVQRHLRRLADQRTQRVAMEASSHALDQGRVTDVRFDIAVFSNLTRDHLDYHVTMERYSMAKRKLFETPSLSAAVVNVDDPMGRRIARELSIETVGFGSSAAAAVSWSDIVRHLDGIEGRWRTPWGSAAFRLPLFGDFSIANAAAALASACLAGARFDDVVARMYDVPPVPGRMQRVPPTAASSSRQPTVIVDFAHTPDALSAALRAARRHLVGSGGRHDTTAPAPDRSAAARTLTCVFGCGGDRDRGKRALMARVAEQDADAVVVTSDNPRGEAPNAIVRDIVAGFAAPRSVTVEVERARAVRLAIERAGPGDVILLAGKGHETYQEISGHRIPYNDFDTARQALTDRGPTRPEAR